MIVLRSGPIKGRERALRETIVTFHHVIVAAILCFCLQGSNPVFAAPAKFVCTGTGYSYETNAKTKKERLVRKQPEKETFVIDLDRKLWHRGSEKVKINIVGSVIYGVVRLDDVFINLELDMSGGPSEYEHDEGDRRYLIGYQCKFE